VALASSALPALGILTLALAWIVWPLLAYVDGAISLCAALPFAALATGDLSPLVAWAYYAGLTGAFWLRTRLPPLLRRSPAPATAATPRAAPSRNTTPRAAA